MNVGKLVQVFLATSAKAMVMEKSLAAGSATLSFFPECHWPHSVIPDFLNRESIFDSSSTLQKTPSHKKFKAQDL